MVVFLVACVAGMAAKSPVADGDSSQVQTASTGDSAPVAESAEPQDSTTDSFVPTGCAAGAAALVGEVEFSTVSEAVTAAPDGATVDVCPGTWMGRIVVERPVAIHGAGPGITVLRGDGSGSVIVIREDAFADVEGLTITGGIGEPDAWGGASGGAVFASGGFALRDVSITGNTAVYGGGITTWGADGTLDRVTLGHNSASICGGGAFLFSGRVALRDSWVEANTSARDGGGVCAWDTWVTAERCTFEANTSGEDGGGFFADGGTVELSACAFRQNAGRYGGGVRYSSNEYPSLTVEECRFEGNHASVGGGLDAFHDDGHWYAPLVVSRSQFVANTAEWCAGLSMSSGYANMSVELRDSEVTSNLATDAGGGVCGYAMVVSGSTITDNEAVGAGGGLYGWVELSNSAVLRNVAGTGGGAWRDTDPFSSSASDWGDGGVDDNVPDDIADASGSYRYGDAADFTCDADQIPTCQ